MVTNDNPDLPLEEFNRMVIDNVAYEIEGREGDDTFLLSDGRSISTSFVHIDKIGEMVRDADGVVLER